MPKFPTFPYLFDEEKCISISDLRKWNYLKMHSRISGTVTWSNRWGVSGKIGITVLMTENERNLKFDYVCNGTEYSYSVELVSLPSNLGKGKVWYFICPFTGKRCRKLHLIEERFMHRSALPSGMYSKQTQSKKWRQMDKVYGCYFDSDKNYQELYSKHFKKYYRGKPTKRYLKLMEQIEKYERLSVRDIEMLYLI